jgi:hypothetical protein
MFIVFSQKRVAIFAKDTSSSIYIPCSEVFKACSNILFVKIKTPQEIEADFIGANDSKPYSNFIYIFKKALKLTAITTKKAG